MAFKLNRIQTLGIKTETAQNTNVVLTASVDYMAVNNVDIKPGKEILERNYKRNTFGTITSTVGKKWWEVTFTVDLIGSGSAGNPTLQTAFKSCGYSASLSTGTASLSPISSTPAGFFSPAYSSTIEVYKDGLKHVLNGCVGTWKISAEDSKYGTAEFSMKGLMSGSVPVTDGTTPTATLTTTTPPIVQSIGLVLGSYAPIGVSKLDIDSGTDVQMIDDVNSANGVYGFIVSDRKPVGSVDPLVDTVANHSSINTMVAGTEFAVNATIGSTAGNKISISAPNTQYTDASYSERNGFVAWNGSLKFNDGSSGNDALTIKLM
jgi:hypothetical protein